MKLRIYVALKEIYPDGIPDQSASVILAAVEKELRKADLPVPSRVFARRFVAKIIPSARPGP
jgi:hypothetical protein